MLGGNSGGMKVNAKSPGTNDLTFAGGWTFSSSGATGNGTNSYANTSYNDNNINSDNRHMGIYSFTPIQNYNVDCGVFSVSANSRTGMYLNEFGNTAGFAVSRSNSGYITWTSTPLNTGAGLYVANRQSSTNEEGYVNGVLRASAIKSSNGTTNLNVIFGARNSDSGPEAFNNRGYNWFSFGSSMTSSQQSTLSTIINTFNTSLGRNTY
jgi:hypothetical protein